MKKNVNKSDFVMEMTSAEIDKSLYLMYVYHGHLKIRKGHLNLVGSFIPDDDPNYRMCGMPFDYYYDNKKLTYAPHIVLDTYKYGKVLFEKEEDILKWKEFFKKLYSDKIERVNSEYKKSLWLGLISEIDDHRTVFDVYATFSEKERELLNKWTSLCYVDPKDIAIYNKMSSEQREVFNYCLYQAEIRREQKN